MTEPNSPQRVREVMDEFKPLRRLLIALCLGHILAALLSLWTYLQTGIAPPTLFFFAGAAGAVVNIYLAVTYRKAVAEAVTAPASAPEPST